MRRRNRRASGPLAALIMLLAIPLLCRCVTDECMDNKNSLPLAGFYSSTEKPQAISIDSISVYGLHAPDDKLILDSARNVTEVNLPFRIEEPSTTFVIRYWQKGLDDVRLNDTIRFDYDPKPWFVSSACGVIYRFDDVKCTTTRHLIDSVTCPLGFIDNKDMQNLRIYFRTKENGKEANL